MNAPRTPPANPAADGILVDAQLDQCIASKTQPRIRKGFDETSLNELAASIRAVGVAQPILIRKIEGNGPIQYEIVAGERRWRASRIAGRASIPALLRTLTDIQVVQIQLIENVQREDLDELEEAEGYERLMKQKDDKGQSYTADRIAELMGVSRATIYARLKLLALCQEVRHIFYKGELDASCALLIARIPVHKLQIEAAKKITAKDWRGETMSYRAAQQFIHNHYMLELSKAPFSPKDAELLTKAGACTDCPKRTGNQPAGLFEDVKSKDVCTDTVCFGMKKAAYALRLQQEAEKKGDTVIKAKEAQKLLPKHTAPEYELPKHGLATLDSHIPNDPKHRTWEQALRSKKLLEPAKGAETAAVKKTLIEHPHEQGEVIQAISIEAAAKALRESGYEVSLRGTSTNSAAKDKQAAAKLKAEVSAENIFRDRLAAALHQKIAEECTGPKAYVHPSLYLLLAEEAFERCYEQKSQARIARNYMGSEEFTNAEQLIEAFEKKLPKLATQEHFLIIIDCLMSGEFFANQHGVQMKRKPETMLRIAEIEGIDAEAIKQDVADEAKAAQNPAAKPKAPAKKSADQTQATPVAAKPEKKAAPAPAPVRPATTWPFPVAPKKAEATT